MGDKYDPDKMTFDDLDIDDPDAVMEYLQHPNTQALHADLGRAFRASPASEQRPEIQRCLEDLEQRLNDVDEWLSTRDYTPEARQALEELRATLKSGIDAARLRLLELDDEA